MQNVKIATAQNLQAFLLLNLMLLALTLVLITNNEWIRAEDVTGNLFSSNTLVRFYSIGASLVAPLVISYQKLCRVGITQTTLEREFKPFCLTISLNFVVFYFVCSLFAAHFGRHGMCML
jgi:hypothetical protein